MSLTLFFWIVGLAYFTWFVYVIAHTSTIEVIDRDSWQFRAYLDFERWNWGDKFRDLAPGNACIYRNGLLQLPLLHLFNVVGLFLFICFLPFYLFFRFIVDWVIVPIILGRMVETGVKPNYFKKIIGFWFCPNNPVHKVYCMSFMPGSPLLWIVLPAGIIYEVVRIKNGTASITELNIFIGALVVVVAILALIWIATRPSFKAMWKEVSAKVCRPLPIVN